MTKTRPVLDGEFYHQQFHNMHHYNQDEHSRPMWYELEDEMQPPQQFEEGGFVEGLARGGAPAATGPRIPHPLAGIPGVHIVGRDAGHPIFTGDE